ncbi:hypothetical protein M378DRAFT_79176, partial [Amanita muscaria Koide BX008]
MSTSTGSITDFNHAVEKLEANASNWVMFQHRFIIAVRHKKVYGQFDGSNMKPESSMAAPSSTVATTQTQTQAHTTALATWQEKEDLALYLLSQKLPDTIFAKYMRKSTVAEMWAGIVAEFTHKSMMMRSHL